MVYRPSVGETEFGGVAGPFPRQQRLAPSLQQEMWADYATDEAGGQDADGGDKSSPEWGADNIGRPRDSFSIMTPEPDLSQVAPWNGEAEGE